MLSEAVLEKYYQQIAEKLDEIIPVDWDRIVMYAEDVDEVSSVCFYYYTNDYTKVHHWGDIPEEYGINKTIFNSLIRELRIINSNLRMEFKNAGETPWCTLTFYLEKDWRFKVKYGYELNLEISPLEREIRWAYDELGIIPDYYYERELLEKYLKSRQTEPPQ